MYFPMDVEYCGLQDSVLMSQTIYCPMDVEYCGLQDSVQMSQTIYRVIYHCKNCLVKMTTGSSYYSSVA